ncbi:amidase [Acidihalobacter ferrooxydans]|uniref:Amidase domain-containing protein n=1 Tax=Acidihalobacter ferrooxydans TaxID=1765967 RepID=A0A1P8UIY6_9GAMM|nr:amidase [Acidihalobacter ferrooxydans]APZ43741.1 hypothetical protein BW247_12135 [Acidihalobacter ferrooxydans]
MKLHELGVRETASLVNSKTLKASEAANYFCTRIKALNPELNAFSYFDEESVIREASEIDARIEQGETLPLAGVAFTVKDNLWMAGAKATFGSNLYKDFIAPTDSWCVARLRELGAFSLGVTTCSEFACKGTTESPLHGITKNPWNTALTPGGSSGGAVACVSSGIGVLALGTDAGGSTRRPAAHTGLVGMKPTLGAVPNPWGFKDPNHLLSVIGQIGKNVEDVAYALHFLTATHATDPLSSPAFSNPTLLNDLYKPLAHPKVGYVVDLSLGLRIDPDVKQSLNQAVGTLANAGIEVESTQIPWPDMPSTYALLELQQAGLAHLYGKEWRISPEIFDPVIGEQIELGMSVSGKRIANLMQLRDSIHVSLSNFFKDFDFLICPTSPVEAWSTGQLGPAVIDGEKASPRDHAAYTPLFNYAGVPAISLPCGVGANNLPIGMQIVAPKYADSSLLNFSCAAEKILNKNLKSPMFNS